MCSSLWNVFGVIAFLSVFQLYPVSGESNSLTFPILEPPTYALWHPQHKTFENMVQYSRIVHSIVMDSSAANGTTLLNIESALLQDIISQKQNHSARRSIGADAVAQFLGGVAVAAEESVHKILACGVSIADFLRQVYNLYYYPNDSDSLLSTVTSLAVNVFSALKTCLEAASEFLPSWMSALINGASEIKSCVDLASDVYKYFTSNPNWYDFGKDLYDCIEGRRQIRQDRKVPNAWTCPPKWYNDSTVCHINCGAFDPSCATGLATVIYTHNIDKVPAPQNWTCLPAMYGDNTTCDVGCGTTDPDCILSGAPIKSWSPELTFSIETKRREINMTSGASSHLEALEKTAIGTPVNHDKTIIVVLSVLCVILVFSTGILISLYYQKTRHNANIEIENDAYASALMDTDSN